MKLNFKQKYFVNYKNTLYCLTTAFLFIITSASSSAQVCSISDNALFQNVSTFPYVQTVAWANDYYDVSVVTGRTYVFSTCGNQVYDTELTIANSTTPTNVIATNNDFCGTSSQITWVATFTGSLRMYIDNVSTCAVTPANQALSITESAPVTPTVNLSVSSNTGSEAATSVITVTATASQAVTGNQTVDINVSGTDITPSDYILSANTITILDGQTTGSVNFTIVDLFRKCYYFSNLGVYFLYFQLNFFNDGQI